MAAAHLSIRTSFRKWAGITAAWGCMALPGFHGVARAADAADSSAPLPEPPYVSSCEPGVRGGRLVTASFVDPKTFNPITANEQSSNDIIRLLFAGLVDWDVVDDKARPGLAESWSVAADEVTWTFKLRKNLRWSDGQPLTADDVVFTWDVIYNPKINNVTADAFRIDGKNFKVVKVDDLTVQVITPSPYAPSVKYVGSIPIIPKHKLSAAVASQSFESSYGINTAPADLVCSGPFRLKDFKPAQFTLLERNPYYFAVDQKGQRLPYLDSVVFTVVPNMDAVTLQLLSGENHVHEYVRPDEFNRLKEEAKKGKFVLHDLGVGLERSFLFFNQNTNLNPQTGKPYVDPKKLAWFRNSTFRRAIAHSIDRPSIVKAVLGGRGVPNYSFVGAANKVWYKSGLPEYPFDLKTARSLLKEIGIEDRNRDGKLEDSTGTVVGFTMLSVKGNPLREKTAVFLQTDFKNLGLDVKVQHVDFNALGGKLQATFDYECMLAALGGGDTDPASGMNVIRSDGYTHWWFPRQKSPSTPWEARLDELMNLQIKTLDLAQRKKYYDEVQEIMNRELPFIYTVAPLNAAAIRSDIRNVRPTVLTSHRLTWNAEELYFAPKK